MTAARRAVRGPLERFWRKFRFVGQGEGVWSWIHLEDAALTTTAALTVPPGIYNVVDDDPSPVSRWLPAFARWLGAAPPPKGTEPQAREAAGEDVVYCSTGHVLP
jgi:nucleoside-diphosphate-sugar epimerase